MWSCSKLVARKNSGKIILEIPQKTLVPNSVISVWDKKTTWGKINGKRCMVVLIFFLMLFFCDFCLQTFKKELWLLVQWTFAWSIPSQIWSIKPYRLSFKNQMHIEFIETEMNTITSVSLAKWPFWKKWPPLALRNFNTWFGVYYLYKLWISKWKFNMRIRSSRSKSWVVELWWEKEAIAEMGATTRLVIMVGHCCAMCRRHLFNYTSCVYLVVFVCC